MAETDSRFVEIEPSISSLVTNTPIVKIGSKYVVGGIGGNFIPTSGVDLSSDTVTAAVVLDGYTFHDKDSNQLSGSIATVSTFIGASIVNSSNGMLSAVYNTSVGYTSASEAVTTVVSAVQVESNLTASNILSGVSMFGISGEAQDVRGDTVVESAVLSGYTFHNETGSGVGTIPVYSGEYYEGEEPSSEAIMDVTPSNSAQILATSSSFVGKYIRVTTDESLIPGNIRSGVSIFGVSGGIKGDAAYYKCSYVEAYPTQQQWTVSGSDAAPTLNGTWIEATAEEKTSYSKRYKKESDSTCYVYWNTTSKVYELYSNNSKISSSGTGYTGSESFEAITFSGWSGTITKGDTPHPEGGGTWGGYRADITSTGISYASSVQSGLLYTSNTPVVNGIFRDDALARIYEDTIIPDNIRKDVTILGVTGTVDAADAYYKCTEVYAASGSTPKGWKGLKLTFNSDGIEYASVATTGLAYDEITPAVNGIYNNGATQRIYEDGLVASNIRKDVTLFGVTGSLDQGVDVSSDTATSGTVLSGYTFHDSTGSSATGVIPTVAQVKPTVVLSGAVVSAYYTPVSGYTSDVEIKESSINLRDKEVNLVAGNIANGVTMFGITGTYTGSAGTVVTQPEPFLNVNKTTGVVSAYYTPLAGVVTDTTQRKTETTLEVDASSVLYGKTVYGTSGTATSGATATADSILSGKTAWVNGSAITGTIPTVVQNNLSMTYSTKGDGGVIGIFTPASGYTSDTAVVSQVIHAGTLIPENIRSGVTIFGVTGTYTGE